MSDIKVCRVCLRTQTKLYKLDEFHLKQYYEEVIAQMIKDDGLPRFFCYECAILLHKYHKFKEKCHHGRQTLQEILWKESITLKAIAKVDRQYTNLTSSIELINKNKRVKTFIIHHKEDEDDVQKDVPSPEMVSLEEYFDVNSPESDYDDKKNYEVFDNDVIEDINDDNKEKIINPENKAVEQEHFEIKTIDEEAKVLMEDLIEPIEEKPEETLSKIKLKNKTPKRRRKRGDTKSKKRREGKKLKVEEKFRQSWHKKQELDSKHWQKFSLSEEEAIKEFKARAQDPKYINAIHRCMGCLKGFSKEDMMKRHIKLRHCESNGSLECKFCRIRFKWKSLLSRHIKEHYNKYKCLRCDLTFSRETSAHHHDQFHNGVTRTCEYCNEKFTHLSTYYTHLRKHRSKHLCALCGESFVSEFGLYMHRRVKHIMDTQESQDTAAAQTTYCERCDVKFETNKAYEEHLIHSTMHSATEETPTLMNLKGGIVIRRVPRKHTQCTVCNKNFSTLTAYTKHHQTEHPDQPLPMVNSARTPGSAPGNLQGQGRYICEICGALLAPNSIYSHVNTHTRERQYTCTTCGMQFNAKGTLQRHYLTHTGEKPVECSLCDKRFTQVASMKLHYRTIHLKEPYPKRTRKRKVEAPEETSLIAEHYNNKEPSNEMSLGKLRTLRW
ncbi:zinc finger protein 345 isoform X1 [Manduca sexta]|uniref:zinc finger protein 345 isoform X1 n=1 Tax=Manduca sexta TaxID=7130 RepID=UPI00188E76F7|nr:zinc finger protein 345 isoform X1 [Manduca sexta]